ncbi:GH-E family nuclease [Streptococcus suis]
MKGKSYKTIFEDYKNGLITLDDLKAFQSDPNNFRLETPGANRSHNYE